MKSLVQAQETNLDYGRNNRKGFIARTGLAISALLMAGCSDFNNPFAEDKQDGAVAPEETAPMVALAPEMATTTVGANSSSNIEMLAPGIDPFGINSEGRDVEILQRNLNAIGCTALVIDGKFGHDTNYVLRTFQQRAGIHVDGIVGAQVIDTLSDMFAAENTNCGAPASAEPMGPIPEPEPENIVPGNIMLTLEEEPVLYGDIPYGCAGGPPGPAAPGTVCPDGQSPAADPERPLGCPGSAQQGPPPPGFNPDTDC